MNINIHAPTLILFLEKVTALLNVTTPTTRNAANMSELIGMVADLRRAAAKELEPIANPQPYRFSGVLDSKGGYPITVQVKCEIINVVEIVAFHNTPGNSPFQNMIDPRDILPKDIATIFSLIQSAKTDRFEIVLSDGLPVGVTVTESPR